MTTRRQVLGTAVSLPVLGQTHNHAPQPAVTPSSPKVFTEDELALIRDLVDTIIPRTDTPGAADAAVHLFIDRYYSLNPQTLAEFRQGLRLASSARRRGRDFTAILTDLQGHPFFKLLKDLTIDGYYTSREGLAVELGWKGYTPLPEFKGCTHPEHQD